MVEEGVSGAQKFAIKITNSKFRVRAASLYVFLYINIMCIIYQRARPPLPPPPPPPQGEIWVSADNQTKCDEWVKALKEAGTV